MRHFPDPLRQVAGLCVLGRGGDEAYVLGLPQYIKGAFGKLVGEQLQVAEDEFTGFMGIGGLSLLWQSGIEHIIVPVKHRFSGILQELEEAGLHFVQHIETDEYIAVVAELVSVELFHDIAIHHALVGDAKFREVPAVAVVDVAQLIPEGDEFGFQLRAFFYGEILEELADGFFLFLVKEVVVIHDVL